MARRRSKAANSDTTDMHSVVPDGYDHGESSEMALCNVPGLQTQVSHGWASSTLRVAM